MKQPAIRMIVLTALGSLMLGCAPSRGLSPDVGANEPADSGGDYAETECEVIQQRLKSYMGKRVIVPIILTGINNDPFTVGKMTITGQSSLINSCIIIASITEEQLPSGALLKRGDRITLKGRVTTMPGAMMPAIAVVEIGRR